jgi:hypothetical protein
MVCENTLVSGENVKHLAIILSFLILLQFTSPLHAGNDYESMPASCDALLPEAFQYTDFLRSVGRVAFVEDKSLARQVFELVSLRDQLFAETNENPDNGVDNMIMGSLCSYVRAKGYDTVTRTSPELQRYLRDNLPGIKTRAVALLLQNRKDRQAERLQKQERSRYQRKLRRFIAEARRDAKALVEKEERKLRMR